MGNNQGDMILHSDNVTCVDFSHSRPWKLLSGSMDNGVCKYKGPPYK